MSHRRQEDAEDFDGRPMRNGRKNGPWWSKWGLLGILVLGMLAVTTGIVPSALTQSKQAAEEGVREIKEHRQKEEEVRREISQRLEEQTRIMRAVCVAVARTDEARERCLR